MAITENRYADENFHREIATVRFESDTDLEIMADSLNASGLKCYYISGSTPKKLVEHGSCGSGEWFSPSPFFRRLKGLRPMGEGGESGLRSE